MQDETWVVIHLSYCQNAARTCVQALGVIGPSKMALPVCNCTCCLPCILRSFPRAQCPLVPQTHQSSPQQHPAPALHPTSAVVAAAPRSSAAAWHLASPYPQAHACSLTTSCTGGTLGPGPYKLQRHGLLHYLLLTADLFLTISANVNALTCKHCCTPASSAMQAARERASK